MAQTTISEAIASGASMEWVENGGSTTLGVGAGTIIRAGVFPLKRKELKSGDKNVTTTNGRKLESVFAITPDGDIKASTLRQAAAMCGIGIRIDNDTHEITLDESFMLVQMPADYDETARKYKTPLKAKPVNQ